MLKKAIQVLTELFDRAKMTFGSRDIKPYFVLGIMMTLMFGTVYPGDRGFPGPQRELSLGQIGADVRWLQGQLNNEGYSVGAVDGVYGLTTRTKVKEYQTKNNLEVTGVFDERTFKKMIEIEHSEKSESKSNSVALSKKDLDLLARAVSGEARGEPYEGQVAVAEVILNRTESSDFPKSVSGVIFEEGAFDAVDDGQIWLEPSRSSIRAALEAAEGTNHTDGALYYFNPAKSTNKWIWTRPQIKTIGDHIFAR